MCLFSTDVATDHGIPQFTRLFAIKSLSCSYFTHSWAAKVVVDSVSCKRLDHVIAVSILSRDTDEFPTARDIKSTRDLTHVLIV